MKHEEKTWHARPHPRGPFRVDITGGVSASSQRQFQWPYFVQRREWFRQHFEGEGFRTRSPSHIEGDADDTGDIGCVSVQPEWSTV